jgi:macrodomain Ter protein organizer (MatP/YcbG family)
MIIDKQKKGNITIYYVDKDYDDDRLHKILNKKLKPDQIKHIIDDDADVYTKDGKLLLKFRKNKLNKAYISEFYELILI